MAGGSSAVVSPGGKGRRGHEDRRSAQAESSGDEITPLASRERGSASGRNYSSTGAKGGDAAGDERVADTGAGEARNRRGGRGNSGGDGDGDGDGDGKEEEGWWSRVVEKFGGVELDNKGSVARDHLALGMLRSPLLMCIALLSPLLPPQVLHFLSPYHNPSSPSSPHPPLPIRPDTRN